MQHTIKSQRALYFSLLENPDLSEANNADGEISLGIGLAFLSRRSLRYSLSKRALAKVLLNERAVSPLQVHPMNPERALPLLGYSLCSAPCVKPMCGFQNVYWK